MLAHVPTPVSGHDFRVPMQPVSMRRESEDATALGQLRARRSHAFIIGEAKARQREISADAYLFLYKELVGLAGDRTYCWPGLDFLVEKLGTSEGTLKRWMKELEQADLIQRKPRPGGQTSLTYITVFLESNVGVEPRSIQALCHDDADEALHAADEAPSNTLPPFAEQIALSLSSVEPSHSPVFFGSEQEITVDRCAGSDVILHTVKSQELKDLNGYGGGFNQSTRSETDVDDEIVMLLKDEDVHDSDAIIELRTKPIAELQALSQYLDKQTNVLCRPGLFVWLARQDFGAKLLAGRRQHKDQHCKGRRKQSNGTNAEAGRFLYPEVEREPVSAELAELWQKVLDQVSLTLPKDMFNVWISPTSLVAFEDNLAVVTTPNIFVRQQIEQLYQAHLEEALSRVCERPIMLQAVIG